MRVKFPKRLLVEASLKTDEAFSGYFALPQHTAEGELIGEYQLISVRRVVREVKQRLEMAPDSTYEVVEN